MRQLIRYPNNYILVGSGLILATWASLVLALFLTAFFNWRAGHAYESCPAPFEMSDNLFALDRQLPELLIINVKQDRLCRIIKLDAIPDRILMSKQAGLIILSNSGTGQVWLVDPAKKEITARLQLNIEPSLLAVSPYGLSLVIADWGEGVIQFYGLPEGNKTGEVHGLAGAHNLRFDAEGALLYVSLADRPEIAIVNAVDRRLEKVIKLDARGGIDHMSRTPDGRLGIAVPPPSDNPRVFLIDLDKTKTIAPLALATPPYRAYSSLYGRYFFLPSSWGGETPVFSVSDRKIIAQLNFDGPVTDIVPGLFGAKYYALGTDAHKVWGVDMDTLKIVDEISLPGEPGGLVTHEASGKLYIPIEERGIIVVIDTRLSTKNAARYTEIKLPGKSPSSIVASGTLSFCH